MTTWERADTSSLVLAFIAGSVTAFATALLLVQVGGSSAERQVPIWVAHTLVSWLVLRRCVAVQSEEREDA